MCPRHPKSVTLLGKVAIPTLSLQEVWEHWTLKDEGEETDAGRETRCFARLTLPTVFPLACSASPSFFSSH